MVGSEVERLCDALLEAGAMAVSIEDFLAGTPDERAQFEQPAQPDAWPQVRVSALFPDSIDAAETLRRASLATGTAVPEPIAIRRVADDDWVRRSQAEFEPIRAGERIWVVPSWHTAPDPRAVNIALDPGLAFGTGSHPTTQLCLRWLERQVHGGEAVLDYGCGSGILAIAAIKLGATRACGVDIDPAALVAAADNASRNRVSCEFHLPGDAPAFMADIIAANILANPLRVLAPLLAARARRGTRLALAGILAEQQESVGRAYQRWFEFVSVERQGDWVLLSGQRNGIAC